MIFHVGNKPWVTFSHPVMRLYMTARCKGLERPKCLNVYVYPKLFAWLLQTLYLPSLQNRMEIPISVQLRKISHWLMTLNHQPVLTEQTLASHPYMLDGPLP